MSVRLRDSILFRTAIGVIGVAYLLGAAVILVSSSVATQRAHDESSRHLGELLDTVERTLSVAVFVGDEQLAREVANGLLKNSEVANVVIRASGREVANLGRGEAPRITALSGRLTRAIRSPFDAKDVIGEVEIRADSEIVDGRIQNEGVFVASLLAVQLAIVSAAVVVIVLFRVVRPIKRLSDRLHRLDAAAGQRLVSPTGSDGSEINRLVDDINGLAGRLVLALEDEHALRLQREVDERKYRAIFENAESGIFVAERNGRLQSFNRSFARQMAMAETAASDGVTRHLQDFPWCEPMQLLDLIGKSLRNGGSVSADVELRLSESACCWLNIAVGAIGTDLVQGIVSDVTERKLAEASARRLAITDPLTGLGNRHGLEQYLFESIRNAPARPFALMLVDLDGFKRINDAIGFPAGDRVLVAAASRLTACLKSTDWVARSGGDEYAVVLPGVAGESDAAGIGTRIVDVLGRVFDVDDSQTFLGASVGITLYPIDGADAPTLLRNAELALERSRAAGGRTFCFFEPRMVEQAEERRRLEADLRVAPRRGHLRLYYQPIVDLGQGRLVGAEALVRWQHPVRGLVSPDAFIPLAEETGLIGELGIWVLEEACRQVAAWREEGRNHYVSVNVSAQQIPDKLPLGLLLETVARYQLPPGCVVLEITESGLLKDTQASLAWLTAVRQAGFRTYLDDFGTGYSSLSYLKHFPMDTVKIDKSFVRDVTEDNSDRALVEAIIMMAGGLGMSVVAEGIETAAQLASLRAMGCSYGQGYFFSKPLPAAEFVLATESFLDRCAGATSDAV